MVIETKQVEVDGKTKKTNKYWHPECYPKELETRKVIDQDHIDKDKLDQTLKKIYNVTFNFSPTFWWKITDLREGTNRFQKFWKKRYKEGVPFEVIREAYLLSVQDIQWARMSKKFKNLEQEMQYGLMIMQGKLNDAFRKLKTREQQDKINEAMESVQIEDMMDNREVSFKKTQQDRDYSYLLGDD